MKKLLLHILNIAGFAWRFIPSKVTSYCLLALVLIDSRDPEPSRSLRRLLTLRDRIDWIINERAMAYNCGEHPKHRLTGYHQFFISHITNGQKVLDVGCGYGAVARSIAFAHPQSTVTAIDVDHDRLTQALSSNNPPNLDFVQLDALKTIPGTGYDVVVLSNVLEHIEDRILFLQKLQKSSASPRYLIRVPLFERDWQIALRRELGVDYRSDNDHKVEHTLDLFESEMSASGLKIIELRTIWGEIWADCSSCTTPCRDQ